VKGTQVKIQRDIASLQSQIKENESSISKLKESLDTKLEVLTGQLYEANTRIDQIENDITKNAKEIDDTYERLLSLERYSRDHNLRFYNIPESTGEDCIAKLRDIIGNDLQLQSNIENVHRIGPFKDDGTPRPILAKFLYRPERFRVIKKKRDLRNGVRVSDDLIWEDRQKKKQLRSVMKEAFEAGKRPRFHHGKLYIDGELHQA
jgi:DNA repair exonuclease SbcCD ATPase subunit